MIPVHFAGQPCEMKAIYKLAKKYGFKIIEDASHAIGASYNKTKIGSCLYSDITVFSFHPVKIITTGEGGMATTNDIALAERMKRLRTHGITRISELMQPRKENEIWNYQQIELGFNYRMSDIQAALGVSQMKSLDDFVRRRREIAKEYDKELSNLPFIIPWQSPSARSSYHLYPIRVRESECGKTQRKVYNSLHAAGIVANLHYIPVHLQPYYEEKGFRAGDFPEAERYYRETISLPMFPTITNDSLVYVLNTLNQIMI